ncbi:MAG: hypothetical protein KDA81_21605, partial [Planctomycetaceae bacterium]|nr:hypothetical protein [Planctomycetaceae bacterium]
MAGDPLSPIEEEVRTSDASPDARMRVSSQCHRGRPNSQNAVQALLASGSGWNIFLISVLGLFAELMLIRWIGTEIRIFAYLQNTVLVVCFLGLGVGCFTCHRPATLKQILVPLLALTAVLSFSQTRSIAGRITSFLSEMEDLLIWEHSVATNPWS